MLPSLEASVYVVSDLTGDCVAKVPIDTDPRLWNSGESSTFTVPIDVRSLRNKENNTYTLYLKCSDTALNRTILFANTQTPTEYGYELGSIEVSKGFISRIFQSSTDVLCCFYHN